jgi:hypothetical protein
MNIDEDFKSIWLRQETAPPPSEKELGQQVEKIRQQSRNKILLAIGMMICTIIIILLISDRWRPHFITTYIGIILMILAIMLYVAATGSLLSFRFRPENKDKSSLQYLQELILLRERQKFLQTRILSLYFILLLAGIFLCMIEHTRRMSVFSQILAYTTTAGWIAFAWFYLRPRSIRKENAKLNELIGTLEKVLDQFNQTP